ncbi:MAG: RNA polymerase sigma factor [Lachnospiraceae bacterium]|nr:RNA polymerase sigma factor [Lachnospiraceae bacterium]
MNDLNHGNLAALVTQTLSGDMSAFSEVYTLTYDKVYNYCRHYLRDSFVAQDAVQEIYILALKNLNKLKNPTLFVAWLNQISFHVCYDMSQKRNADYALVDDEILETFYDTHPDSDPAGKALKASEQASLRDAINTLPPLQRSVITLRFYNNLKLDDIADAMDISLSSVKRYLEQAKQLLKQTLSNS